MKCEKCNHEYTDDLAMCPVCGESNPHYHAPTDDLLTKQSRPSHDTAEKQTASGTTTGPSSGQSGSAQQNNNYSWNQDSASHSSQGQRAAQGGSTQSGYGQSGGYGSQYGGATGQQYGAQGNAGYGQRAYNGQQGGYGNQQGAQYGPGYGGQQGGQYGPGYGGQQNQYGPGYGEQGGYGQPKPKGSNKTSVAVLVLGIISLIIPIAGFITAIIAIVLGNKAKTECARGTTDYAMANAGWIMGIIGVVLQGAILALMITGLAFASSILGSLASYSWPFLWID